MYKNIRICISTYLKYFHTFNHNTFSYDIILSGSEPFSLNGEFHWWSRAQEGSKFTNWPGLLFHIEQGQSLSIGRVCFPHVRLDAAALGSTLAVMICIGYSKWIPAQPLLKKSMNWNNHTPILPNSTDQLTLDPARENQAHCYLAEAPGGRVYKTQECWGQER